MNGTCGIVFLKVPGMIEQREDVQETEKDRNFKQIFRNFK
jgi:hypothetical protein